MLMPANPCAKLIPVEYLLQWPWCALCAPKPIRPGYENPLETFGNSSHIRTSKATRTATTRFSSARCVVALAWGLLRFAALRCTQHQESKKPDTWPGSRSGGATGCQVSGLTPGQRCN